MSLINFIVSVVYTLAGLTAFIAFLILQYYSAAVFAFIAATVSAVTAHLNWLHKTRRLNLWYEQSELSQLYWLGFWMFAFGFSGFVFHLVYYLFLQQYLNFNLILACIWGVIMVKLAIMLMYYSNKYHDEAIAGSLIVNEDNNAA